MLCSKPHLESFAITSLNLRLEFCPCEGIDLYLQEGNLLQKLPWKGTYRCNHVLILKKKKKNIKGNYAFFSP